MRDSWVPGHPRFYCRMDPIPIVCFQPVAGVSIGFGCRVELRMVVCQPGRRSAAPRTAEPHIVAGSGGAGDRSISNRNSVSFYHAAILVHTRESARMDACEPKPRIAGRTTADQACRLLG